MSTTASEKISQLLQNSSPINGKNGSEDINGSSKTKLNPSTSSPSQQVMQRLTQNSSKRGSANSGCPPKGGGVQLIALGDLTQREKLYGQYHQGSHIAAYRYLRTVKTHLDDKPDAPFMMGWACYGVKKPETSNPFDEKKQNKEWMDWFSGYHHARRQAGDHLPEDSV